MRIIIILILSLLFLLVLFVSDFFLTNVIKEKVNECNRQTQEHNNFKAVTLFKIILLSALVWLLPLELLPEAFKLEYKIILTLLYWSILFFLIFYYLSKKTTSLLAQKSWALLVIPAFISGIIIVPFFVIMKELFR